MTRQPGFLVQLQSYLSARGYDLTVTQTEALDSVMGRYQMFDLVLSWRRFCDEKQLESY